MCPMRFTNKSGVARHERTHTDEKPYACSMCPRRFADKGNVSRHERTHTVLKGNGNPVEGRSPSSNTVLQL